MTSTAPSIVLWLFGITVIVVLALAGMTWYHWRDTTKRFSEQDRRFTELTALMASAVKAAEIYERTQDRAAEAYGRTHQSLLETLREMTKSTHDMYRDASTRFAQLEERSTNHSQELRRNAENTHNLRTEARNALEKNIREVREDLSRLSQLHHEDMARIQLRRHSDT